MVERWRVTSAKSIVALAAEQEAQDQLARKASWKRGLASFFFVVQALGWWWFHCGKTSQGSSLVLLGLVGWLFAGGLGAAFKTQTASWVAALAVGGATGVFFAGFRALTFQWGGDVSFYRAVLENHIPNAFPSPLAYLTAQSFLPVLKGVWPDLPILSVMAFGSAMGLLALFLLESSRKSVETKLFALGVVAAVAASLPVALFSSRAVGLIPGLGLILGLLLLRLRDVRKHPNNAAYLLAGLMASLNPLWGLLGLLLLFKDPADALKRFPEGAWAYMAGCTPYLWVYLNAGKTLGSWGGDHHWAALLGLVREGWAFPNHVGPSAMAVPEILGWSLMAFGVTLSLIGWKTSGIGGRLLQALGAGAGAYLFASKTGGLPGSTAAWLPILVASWWASLYREVKSVGGYGSGFQRLVAWSSIAAAIALAFLPAERSARWLSAAPQRHAENLQACVRNDREPVLLLSEDLFEVDAVSLLQERGGRADGLVVVAAPYLDDRWYLSELIRLRPGILIATASGTRESLFNDLVRRNIGRWDVEWSVSEMPPVPGLAPERSGFKAVPRVLTHRFVGMQDKTLGDDPTSRCDLADLMEETHRKGGPARIALSRYAVGLQSWAVAQTRAGLYPTALRGFERALSIDPTYEAPQQALERLYNEKAMVDAARLQFEQTARVLPGRLQSLDRTLAQTAPDSRTSLLAQKAQMTEELVDALHHLGVIYDHLGRYDDSQKVLEEVLRYRPSRSETQLALAQLFLKVGNRVQAQAAFKAVLQADPENKVAQAELWKLINKP